MKQDLVKSDDGAAYFYGPAWMTVELGPDSHIFHDVAFISVDEDAGEDARSYHIVLRGFCLSHAMVSMNEHGSWVVDGVWRPGVMPGWHSKEEAMREAAEHLLTNADIVSG